MSDKVVIGDMENRDHNKAFGLLAALTNADLPSDETERALYDQFNKLQETVNTALPDLIDRSSFPRKYEVLEKIKALLLSVRLYMTVPELINTHVFGYYHPNSAALLSLRAQYLTKAVPESKFGKKSLLSGVPTLLLHGDSREAEFFALSANDRKVNLTDDDYRELLSRDNRGAKDPDRIDFSGIVRFAAVKSSLIPDGIAVVILPKKSAWQEKYSRTLIDLMDTVVLSCSAGKIGIEKNTFAESNVKRVIVHGAQPEIAQNDLVFKHFSPDFLRANDLSDPFSAFETYHNFNNCTVLESLFSEILWWISVDRSTLNSRLAMLNNDLLNTDNNVMGLIRELREFAQKQLDESDEICGQYRSVRSEMKECIESIEQLRGIDPATGYNNHAMTKAELLGHFYRMCAFYHETSYLDAHQAIPDLRERCVSVDDACANIAMIISSDYHHRKSAQNRMDCLRDISSGDPFIGRLKIRHRNDIQLDDVSCGQIVDALPEPLTPEELRLLGNYHLTCGEKSAAKKELYEAMAAGDIPAGETYMLHFCAGKTDKQDAALFGVTAAALAMGKEYAQKWKRNKKNDALFSGAVKYLNIAGAKGMGEAFALLGEIWFLNGIKNQKADDDRMKNSLRACIRNYENAPNEMRDYTQMGVAAFHLKEYNTAKAYLQRANTGEACAMLGRMYDKGIGVSKNRNTAMRQYKKAVNLGYVQAQTSYNRLQAQIEREKRRREELEAMSYEETTTTSGYSRHSGW